MTSALIDVQTLSDWLRSDCPPVVLDARARLDDAGAGAALWRARHVPGARHADMDRDLSAPPSPAGGRHPLPDKAGLSHTLRGWGITPDRPVIAYDDTGGRLAAARAWWLLQWAGHPGAYVLDGGWPAWTAADRPVDTVAPDVTPSDWQPTFDDTLIADVDDVARGNAVLLDARAGERYRGAVEPIDPAAGHIPGARNVPGSALLGADTRLLPAADLRGHLPAADDVIAYCGSGISACQLILAYATLGAPLPRLYPGSWSAWSADPARPVATGAAPDA